MVQGGGVDGRDGSGSGVLLTESSDISRRIRSNLLQRRGEDDRIPAGSRENHSLEYDNSSRVLFLQLLMKTLK